MIGHPDTLRVPQQAVLLLWWLLWCHFQDRSGVDFLWRQNWVCQPRQTGRAGVSVSFWSDSVWQGSSILINLIVSLKKRCVSSLPANSLCDHSPSPRSPSVLITCHIKGSFLRLSHPGWLLYDRPRRFRAVLIWGHPKSQLFLIIRPCRFVISGLGFECPTVSKWDVPIPTVDVTSG